MDNSDLTRSVGTYSGFRRGVAYLEQEGVWDKRLARSLRQVARNLRIVERDLFIACRVEGMTLSRSGVVITDPVKAASRMGVSGVQAITTAYRGMEYLRGILFSQVGVTVMDYETTGRTRIDSPLPRRIDPALAVRRDIDLARSVAAKSGQALLKAAEAAYLSVRLMIKEGIPQMTLPCFVLGAVTYCLASSAELVS